MGEKSKIAKTAVIALFLLLSAFVIFGMNTVTAAPDVPGAPTGLSATSGINNVTLTWTAPASDGGSPIDYYIVYQDGTALADHYVGLRAVVSVPYQYHSPMDWNPYVWTVAAHNAAGTGLPSEPQSAYPVNTPGMVESFTADGDDGSAYLTWHIDGRSEAGGLTIISTIIYQDGLDIAHVASGNDLRVSGLTNGKAYNFSAAWQNEVGIGPHTDPIKVIPLGIPGAPTGLSQTPLNQAVNLTWSAPTNTGGAVDFYEIYQEGNSLGRTSHTYFLVSGLTNGQIYHFAVAAGNSKGQGAQASVASTPVPDPAGAPTALMANTGNGQVVLTWTAPANNGGAAIDYYVVYQNDIDINHVQAETSMTVTGLVNGQSYTFAVAAHNSAGLSVKSDSVQAIPFTISNAPTGLTAVAGNGQVALNWTAAAYDGGRAVDYYVVYQDGVALTYQFTGPMTTISGLVNGQAYSFTVAGHNLAGVGAQSTAAAATPLAVPDAPTGLTAVPGHLQIALNWTAPLLIGGSPIGYYIVYQNGVDVQHTTGTSFTFTGLTSGQTYDFAVSARNQAGEGPKTPIVAAAPRPALTSPGFPTGLTALAGDGKVDLSWSLPADNGGASIDFYVVYQNDIDIMHVTGNSLSITGLPNGQTYSFAIAAHNSIGLSARSDAVLATPYTLPGIPTGLKAAAGNGFATLTWTAPSNNGGAVIDHYVVYQDGVALSVDPTGLSSVITGLTNGQLYNFTLAAHNQAGTGPTVYATVTPTQTVPSEPLGVSATNIDSGIVLGWSAPSDNGGYPVTYTIFRGAVSGSESKLADISATSYTDKDVVLGTSYFYYVKAVNQLGSSIQSKEAGPITASAAVVLDMETGSSSSIGTLMTVTGTVVRASVGAPIAGLSINLAYSVNNGQTWIEMPSVNTSSKGNFTAQWIPSATGIYMLRGTWAGNAIYQPSTSVKSLAITATSDKYVFTVQSNSTISDLSFNSNSKKLSFNVTGETGTFGYSRIVISKDLVANGSEIRLSLDGNEMSYQLNSTDSSWILYFEYHHSTHSIVASLNEGANSGDKNSPNNSPLPLVAIAGLAVVSALLVAGLVLFNRRRSRK